MIPPGLAAFALFLIFVFVCLVVASAIKHR